VEPQVIPTPNPQMEPATQHVTDAHHLLKMLRDKIDQHPELDEAIEKLEEFAYLIRIYFEEFIGIQPFYGSQVFSEWKFNPELL
jgi:predicted translin family RNA/ssDNA-binding protein